MFRIWCSHYFTLQVIAITSLDVIPKLWHVSEGVKIPYFCKELEEFWESCVFLIFCWLGYRILNLPNYLYRYYVFKENVVREFYGRKNRNWLFHSMAKGFPTPAVLFLVTMTALEFTIPRKRFNRQYLILVGSFQVAYVILYPILTLPRAKTLSVLEPGRLRYSMEELTKTAGFPLKNIYVVDNIIYDANTGVQAWGWPRKTYITIHKSIVEQHTLDNVVGLLAQELGCWKFGNGPRVFVLGQVIARNMKTKDRTD
jgi:STE24 endopeptidase